MRLQAHFLFGVILMKYEVNVIAACDADIWTTNTATFPADVKKTIEDLNVDYKFKITSAGAQRSSWDSEDLLTISRHYTSVVKATFSLDSLSDVQTFETNLSEICSKLDSDYKLKIRTKNRIV